MLATPETARPPRVVAYGGGLDSFAMLVEGIRRGERPDVVCFVDVGDPNREDPAEWPGTYRHLEEVVRPLCAREGIEFVWLNTVAYPVRGERSLFAWLKSRKQIPVAGPARLCTTIAKVERFEQWLSDRWPGQEVEVWVGFEAGEEKRAAKDPNAGGRRKARRKKVVKGEPPPPPPAQRCNRFVLIEWRMCRCRCAERIRDSGYPLPPGSACVFCPYATKGDWQMLERELPHYWLQVVLLEALKPLTGNGTMLSIMGFRTLYDKAGNKVGYKAPLLPIFIKGEYKPKKKSCEVCGAPVKVRKKMSCTYEAAA